MVTRRYEDVQFRSVEENFAIIETENTEDTSHFCSRYKKPVSLIDHGLRVDEDKTSVKTDVILCQIDENSIVSHFASRRRAIGESWTQAMP